jgi:hypothetical protein
MNSLLPAVLELPEISKQIAADHPQPPPTRLSRNQGANRNKVLAHGLLLANFVLQALFLFPELLYVIRSVGNRDRLTPLHQFPDFFDYIWVR